ncbi:hypothetical protein CBZ_22450 [Cellulomonas biazotea]|uniref:Uncharacterized protein n=1 Tax=Cellulomonas biazotea TaxID=1709 RepID=A0A402DSR6_9CELL|nr:hypothetical protein CBZ_22450 [Cellulomonas biazotea]
MRGGRRAREVEPLPGERPLREVDVRVPQAGHHRPPVERDVLGARSGDVREVRPERGDPPVPDQHVDRDGVPEPSGATQQQGVICPVSDVAHAKTAATVAM